MGISGRVCVFIGLLALGACETPVSTTELNPGLSEATVVEIMGEQPLNRAEFSMPDNPETKFTALQYNMSSKADLGATPHWILFDADGLVTFGEGGIAEAQMRAYSAYYDWMSGHGKMSRHEAESRIYEGYKQAYGRNLNPTVDQYLQHRVAVMQRVDAAEINLQEADRLISEEYASLSRSYSPFGKSQASQDDGSSLGRATAVATLGPDLSALYGGRRPRAARTSAGFCPSSGGTRALAQSMRCF